MPRKSKKRVHQFDTIPPSIIPEVDFQLAYASHLVNPNEFYIQFILPHQLTIEEFQETLQSEGPLLERPTNLPNYKNIKSLINTGWVAKYSEDGQWYRAQIEQILDSDDMLANLEDLSLATVMIKFVDYGNTEKMNIEDLRYLPWKLSSIPAYATQCSLSLIKSPNNGWSEESLYEFQNLLGFSDNEQERKLLNVHILDKGHRVPLKVLLWSGNSIKVGYDNKLINACLVSDFHALTDDNEWVEEAEKQIGMRRNVEIATAHILSVANRVLNSIKPIKSTNRTLNNGNCNVNGGGENSQNGNQSPKSEGDEQLLNAWNPMEEHALAKTNSYAYNENSLSVRLNGYEYKEPVGVCRNFYFNGSCKFGDDCVMKHLRHQDVHTLDREDVVIDALSTITSFVPDSIHRMFVTSVENPKSFYCIPYDEEKSDIGTISLKNYESLENEMEAFYTLPENQENVEVLPGIGSLVAFSSPEEGFKRGKVIEILDGDDDCLIFGIDSGIYYVRPRYDVYTLENTFAVLPALAVQCAIAQISPIKGFEWPEDVRNRFEQLIQDREFSVLVKSVEYEGRLQVELRRGDDEISAILIREMMARKSRI
ncbi:uncharacterized protein LOC141854321 [Brevipalpus obovatus]|uniref:uncharacterized protein LOC141854321 n=1 Tax=Brevipalpus obovatus TaxID=246614 RepID=UPI003D9E2374